MENAELKRIVEALIFAADEPVTVDRLAKALDEPDKKIVRELVHALRDEYEEEGRGFTLHEVGGAYQFRTRPAYAPWIQRLNQAKPARFSGPALETLAIIAYKQPALRQEIDDIRGVDSGAVLKSLLERHLIKIVGRKDIPGRPLLYGTTKEFLSLFNLKNLAELPSLRDLKELETDPTSQIEMLFPERGDLGELAELPDAPAELTEPIPESIAADAPESFADEGQAESAEGPIEAPSAFDLADAFRRAEEHGGYFRSPDDPVSFQADPPAYDEEGLVSEADDFADEIDEDAGEDDDPASRN